MLAVAALTFGFNTQPPEGGWKSSNLSTTAHYGFNTQPPEGGWEPSNTPSIAPQRFQHTAA